MIVRLILVLLYLLLITESAYVKSYQCSNLKQEDISFQTIATEAYYDEDQELLKFKIISNVSENTIDVNYTTNMYTTLHVRIEFTGGEILDKYLRLCDYVSRLVPEDLPFAYPNSSSLFNSSSSAPSSSALLSSALPPFSATLILSDTLIANQASTQTGVTPWSTSNAADANSNGLTNMVPQANGKREVFENDLVPREENEGDSTICPLYQNELVDINYNVSIGKYHKFGSYDLRFSIISADSSQTIIGCTQFYVTPKLPDAAVRGVSIGVAALACWMVLVSFFTLIFSPYQESKNPFLLFCSTICNAPLLNQLTPLYDDFIVYLHFLFFMAGLDVQYPGFYQPLVSSIRWILLLSSSFQKNKTDPVQNNIYATFGASPLGCLTLFSTSDVEGDAWVNFMWLFASIIAGLLVLTLLATLVLWLRNKHNNDYHGFKSKIIYHSLGLVTRMFFFVFATPFLVLTIYLWTASGTKGSKKWALGLGVVFFAAWILCATFFIINYILITKNRARLYSSLKVILLWSGLYHKYEPAKVYYFILECFEILMFSIIVGLLRSTGTIQVSLIIVLESFSLLCLIYIKPYYLKTKLNSSKIVIGVAKLVTSILTIPYIRSLNIREKNRTYVAYLESFLHLFVIFFFFFLPSIYCLISTIISMIKYSKGRLNFDEKSEADVPLSHKNSYRNIPQTTANSIASDPFANDYSYYRQPHQSTMNWPPALYRQDSNISTSTANLELTDKRVLPLVGLTTNSIMNDNDSNSKNVDYSVREVDKFYNASRVLEPDPEVKMLWEAREGRRYAGTLNEVEDQPLLQTEQQQQPFMYHQQQQQQQRQNRLNWLFQKRKKRAPVARRFEVDRPRQIMVRRPSLSLLLLLLLPFDDTTTTDIGSSILLKDDFEDEFTSETATRTSMKHYDDDYEDDEYGAGEKLHDNVFGDDKLMKKMQDDVITEESDEDERNDSSDAAEFMSFEENDDNGR